MGTVLHKLYCSNRDARDIMLFPEFIEQESADGNSTGSANSKNIWILTRINLFSGFCI
jgi:hypothetical protein